MIEIITPCGKLGEFSWEFFAKSIEAKDIIICDALSQMIGFAISEPIKKHYYVGELTEDKQLEYFYGGAYEKFAIPKKSVIFYSKQELLSMLCEQYEKATNKQLKLN